MSPLLRALGEGYCEANQRKFSHYVDELLREDLRKKGFPVDASYDEVMRFVESAKVKHADEDAPPKKKAPRRRTMKRDARNCE